MKTYRLYSAILMVALCFNFVSCSDDDENDGGIIGNSVKRLTRIEVYDADDQTNHELSCTINYEYNGNKLSRITTSSDEPSLNEMYEINGKEIIVHDTYNNRILGTYTLNNNGFIQSSTWDTKYSYYSDGYLKSIESVGNFEEIENYTYNYDKEWNLIRTSDIPNILYPDKILNKGNLFVWDGLAGSGRPHIDILASAGFLGKTPQYLVQKFDYNDNEPDLYEYELDKAGYVNQVKITFVMGDSEEYNQYAIYKYTYEEVK